jgi:hypothetical protein
MKRVISFHYEQSNYPSLLGKIEKNNISNCSFKREEINERRPNENQRYSIYSNGLIAAAPL